MANRWGMGNDSGSGERVGTAAGGHLVRDGGEEEARIYMPTVADETDAEQIRRPQDQERWI